MQRFLRGLRLVDPRDWWWINFKFAIGLLVPILAFNRAPSPVQNQNLDHGLINILMSVMILGAALSIIGMLLRGTQMYHRIIGYSVEITGLVFLFIGPFLLSIGYTYNAWVQNTSYLAAGFCYAITAAIVARFVDVYFHTLESKQPGDPLISRE